jgi:hypothetical protein
LEKARSNYDGFREGMSRNHQDPSISRCQHASTVEKLTRRRLSLGLDSAIV